MYVGLNKFYFTYQHMDSILNALNSGIFIKTSRKFKLKKKEANVTFICTLPGQKKKRLLFGF